MEEAVANVVWSWRFGKDSTFKRCAFCGRRQLEFEGMYIDKSPVCSREGHFPIWVCSVCYESRTTWYCPACAKEAADDAGLGE